MMKKLIILDLDNTLIYASFSRLPANILFKYAGYLPIYERPHAKEFVQKCRTIADVVVVTTAVRDYAEKVCEHLQIKPIELFSREDCLILNNEYVKSVPDYYFDLYDDIIIFDDSPELWNKKSHEKCRVIEVAPFTGEAACKIVSKALIHCISFIMCCRITNPVTINFIQDVVGAFMIDYITASRKIVGAKKHRITCKCIVSGIIHPCIETGRACPRNNP
jgi:hypothetical protein